MLDKADMGEREGKFPEAFGYLLTSAYHVADRSWALLLNFLTVQSILLLAWGAILAADAPPAKALVMLVISVVGVFTSLQWSLLGLRMWQYHLEYAARVRLLSLQFSVGELGSGADAWSEVDRVMDADWREKEDFKRFRWWSGHHVILFTAPLLLAFIHLVTFVVTLFSVVAWPTEKVWPPYAFGAIGTGLTIWGCWIACKIAAPILKRNPFGDG